MVNGLDGVYIERDGKIEETDGRFFSEAHVLRVIDRIVAPLGRRIDESSPMVDARLPDGSRVNAVIAPLAIDGPQLTIRKFTQRVLTLDDLVRLGTLTTQVGDFLAACVTGRMNILISGGTGTGKTTLLNVLSSMIPANERIVTIEDAAELRLQQRHVIRLESRPANIEGKGEVRTRDLLRNALRMRPDRIVVGEVRGAEALDMLQAMNTGHDGSLSTLHANSPRDALARVETMVLMAGFDLPVRAIREQAASAIDLLVHIAAGATGSDEWPAWPPSTGWKARPSPSPTSSASRPSLGATGRSAGDSAPPGCARSWPNGCTTPVFRSRATSSATPGNAASGQPPAGTEIAATSSLAGAPAGRARARSRRGRGSVASPAPVSACTAGRVGSSTCRGTARCRGRRPRGRRCPRRCTASPVRCRPAPTS